MNDINESRENKKYPEKIFNDLTRPIIKHDTWSTAWLLFVLTIIVLGLWGWTIQLRKGLGVTGLNDYVSWGLYLGNFVFFVAVSLIGMLISSVMHLLRIEWVKPISRVAEQVAIAAVALAGVVIIMDMGRPDRVLNVFLNARFASPILWDVTVISTYLVISTLLIYVPLIPDIAMLRDKLDGIPKWQKTAYSILSIGWQGTKEQFEIVKKTMFVLLILVIPVGISIHTVTAWLFASTLRPGWDSTIFGPYFVTGAFVAGTAAVIMVMYVYRRRYKLKEYFTDRHFNNMAKVLVLMSLVYLYFNINEFLVPGYKMKTADSHHLHELFTGRHAPMFWAVQIGGLILPVILMLFRWFRKPAPLFTISLVMLVAAWFKRYLIVVPTMEHPFLPIQNVPENWHFYVPTGTEIFIGLFAVGAALLIITVLAKVFPVIPVWELTEYHEQKEKNKENQ